MNNYGNERRRTDEPVGYQVPELLCRCAGLLAADHNGHQPDRPGLLEELGIDRDAIRQHYLEQLAAGGIELVN